MVLGRHGRQVWVAGTRVSLLAPPSLGSGPFQHIQDSSHHVHFLSTSMEEEEKGQEEHDVLLPGTSTGIPLSRTSSHDHALPQRRLGNEVFILEGQVPS